MPLLSIHKAYKSFGGLAAVSDVSLSLEKGQILGIIGPNGAGKTTLFNLISRFLDLDSGEIKLEDRSILGLTPHRLCKLGLSRTFQIVKPFPTLTVLENVAVGAMNQTRTAGQAEELAWSILEQVGLSELAFQEASELTLAWRKRLELARTLATKPRILLLDEVMAGLSPTEVDILINVIRKINQEGISIMLIEHVMRGLMALAQHVIVLNYGEKIAEGTPEQVVHDESVIEAYLGKEFANHALD